MDIFDCLLDVVGRWSVSFWVRLIFILFENCDGPIFSKL